MTPVFSTQDISFRYHLGNLQVRALQGVSLKVKSGEITCLSGPSGSGKTTLLSLLGLVEELQEGEIFFQGTPLSQLNEKEKNQIRRYQLGFVFQNFHLFPVLNARENVEYFLTRQGLKPEDVAKRSEEALRAVGLWEHRMKRPLEMSGGQRQRVAIARAVAKRPQVIIADEPTASLDQVTGKEIMEILSTLIKSSKQNVTILLSSHDPMVISFSDRVIKMKDGKIESDEEYQTSSTKMSSGLKLNPSDSSHENKEEVRQ